MDAQSETTRRGLINLQQIRSFLHPAAGLLILVADWFFFSGTALTGGALLAHASLLGFIVGFCGTVYFQRRFARERWEPALWKGVLAGGLVGFPAPIGGTLIGGVVLAFSGFDQIRQQAAKALAEDTGEGADAVEVEE